MTRKDYIAFARIIRDVAAHKAIDPLYGEGWQAATSSVAHRVALLLAQDNPRFDNARFFEACGLEGAK